MYIHIYQNTWFRWVQLYFGEIAGLLDNEGLLVDTHIGSYDCKLNTIEGSHCSTTENKIYLKCCLFFYFYFRFRNVQNCSKIINYLILHLRYLSK